MTASCVVILPTFCILFYIFISYLVITFNNIKLESVHYMVLIFILAVSFIFSCYIGKIMDKKNQVNINHLLSMTSKRSNSRVATQTNNNDTFATNATNTTNMFYSTAKILPLLSR